MMRMMIFLKMMNYYYCYSNEKMMEYLLFHEVLKKKRRRRRMRLKMMLELWVTVESYLLYLHPVDLTEQNDFSFDEETLKEDYVQKKKKKKKKMFLCLFEK